MSLAPQGVSGNSQYGGTLNWADYPNTASPGGIFYLGRWTGQTLRHLSLSVLASTSSIYSILQIATDYPRDGLSPANALLNPLYQVYLDTAVLAYGGGSLVLDFEPGLITVLPGEDLYVIVYDWKTNSVSASMLWSLNMLWEPLREEK